LENVLPTFRHWVLALLIAAGCCGTVQAQCDAAAGCETCAKEPEYAWNPDDAHVTPRLRQFYQVGRDLATAYRDQKYDQARKLAGTYLELAAVYRCNWNYGNAIHESNRVLGLISVAGGDLDAAAQYLVKAGQSAGSPQLNSFGPQLDLANQLLRRGRRDAVRTYLGGVRRFWVTGTVALDRWIAQIDQGATPDLNRLLATQPAAMQRVLSWLLMIWPFLVGATVLAANRQRIQRKLTFLAAAVPVGYVALVIGRWIASQPFWLGHGSAVLEAALAVAVPLLTAWLFPVLAIAAVARAFLPRPAQG
jgi:hypothetical protein